MIQIHFRNVYSTINLPESYQQSFDDFLACRYPSYWFVKRYRQGLWDGYYRFFKRGKFPTGLLFLVEEWLRTHNLPYEVVDTVKKPSESLSNRRSLKGVVLRPYQLEAVAEALSKGRGIIELGTGGGKTEIAAAVIKALGRQTLFMVNTKELLYQTQERFRERLGKDIGLMGDGVTDVGHDIIIATVQTIHNLFKRDQKLAKEFLATFEVLFLDEVHHSSSYSYYTVCMFIHNARWRFGLSGTPLKRDVLSNMKVMAVTGPIIYSKRSQELIKEDYLAKIEIEMVENEEIIHSSGRWQAIYRDGVVQSLTRNSRIVSIAEREFKAGRRVMVLVRHIDHGNRLQRMLVNGKHIPTIFLYGKHESWERNQVKHRFNEEGKMVLIASTIMEEGVDLPEIDVLIIGAGGKSEIKTIQRVGRGLRKKKSGGGLKVYDFDDGSKYLIDHSQKRIETYRKEGFLE